MSTATLPEPTQMQRREIRDGIRSIAAGARSREAVLATDQPVDVYDARTGRVIAEILVIEGASWRDPITAHVDHDRGIPATVGSVTNIRREPGKLSGTFHFATGTQAADEAWALVSGGHVRDVSVGYRIERSTEIPAGRSKSVDGKVYTAPAGRTLRVVSQWRLIEASVVSVGADD